MASAIIDLLRKSGVECLTREQWGSPRQADGSYNRRALTHRMPVGPAPYHFLHITVTGDTDTILEARAGAKQVESYGLSAPPMVSYQDLVTNEGTYLEGQSYGVKGTHTVNDKQVGGFPHDLNLYGYACAIMQNVQDEVTDIQVEVIARVFAARELLGLVRRGAPIYPHRVFDWKECPGDKAVARLDAISRLRTKYVREGLPNMEDLMPTPAETRTIIKEELEKALDPVLSALKRIAKRDLAQTQRIRKSIERNADLSADDKAYLASLLDASEEVGR